MKNYEVMSLDLLLGLKTKIKVGLNLINQFFNPSGILQIGIGIILCLF